MKRSNMKRIFSVLMAVVMMSAAVVPSFAVSVTDYNALVEEFPVKKASNGMQYAAYEPNVTEGVKYPLVVYVHGLFHGWTDTTFKKSGLTYWASDEVQMHFKEGGAYLLMPRVPVYEMLTAQNRIFNVITEYVEAHPDIDVNQVYIMGGSAGGALTWKLLINHPNYFRRAVVLCGCKAITKAQAQQFSGTPIWMISAKADPLVWYGVFSKPNWDKVIATNDSVADCRHTVFNGQVTVPDGSRALTHFLAKTIGYNLCTISDKKLFKNMTTIDGNKNTVDISFDNSIIEWLQAGIEVPVNTVPELLTELN